MPDCRKCGQPITAGNCRVIRQPGKRAYRVHRHCPVMTAVNQAHSEAAHSKISEVAQSVVFYSPAIGQNILEDNLHMKRAGYRYFLDRNFIEKLERAAGQGKIMAMVNIMIFSEEQVDYDPEIVNGLTEIFPNLADE